VQLVSEKYMRVIEGPLWRSTREAAAGVVGAACVNGRERRGRRVSKADDLNIFNEASDVFFVMRFIGRCEGFSVDSKTITI